jgi:hypothetical protein
MKIDSESVSLVSFPGGVPQDADEMELLFGEKKGSKRKRCAIGDLKGLTFKALDSGEGSAKNALCKYGIVRVNISTKSVDLLKVSNVFAMRPQVGLSDENAPARLSTMTADERRKSLHEFGSSKKQRAVKQAASNQIQDNAVAGASAVEKAIFKASAADEAAGGASGDGNVVQDAAEYALEQNRRLLLPTYDEKAATDYAEAYPRDYLLTGDLSDELDTFYESLLPADIKEVKSKRVIAASTESVLEHLQGSLKSCTTIINLVRQAESNFTEQLTLASDSGEGGLKKKTVNRLFRADMGLLMHLHFVLQFYKVITKNTRGPTSKAEISNQLKSAPGAVVDNLVRMFGQVSKREGNPVVSVTQFNRDKLMCHILVTGMHVSNNLFNLTQLAEDLQTNEAHLVKYVRIVGMRTVRAKAEPNGGTPAHTASELKVLPIVFPGPPRKQGKK